VFIEAAIILPNSYNINAPSNYPIIFVFPGFGSHHASVTYGNRQINRYGINTVGKEKIFIFCNAEFKNGYHHFANSSNNGPWADAFITEFIPFINSKFNCTSQHKSYFLMGQSSGAWTSAWLIVNNPELFSGAFIASPDPIDFREMAFNIYKNNANFYFPEEPNSKQLTKGKKDKQYILLEDIVDEYGQIKSWEATFSPKSKNNLPARLFNRESGEIYPEVAENWKKYDISRIIKSRPEYFQNSLKNKLHFFVSEDDPYGLAKSIHLFETICSENNIEANFNYYNELGHNIWIDTVRNKIHQIIDSNEP
jgi:hypothetical protein